MQILPYILLYLVPTSIAAALTILSWQRRYYRGGRTFSLMMAALTFWFSCQLLIVLDPGESGTLRWMMLQYGGIIMLPPAWLLFALAYSGQWWRTTRLSRRALFIVPALSYALALTNDLHRLWWSNWSLNPLRPYVYLSTVNGPAYWLHIIYSYLCILAGLALLISAIRRGSGPQRYYARLVLIGALVAPIGNITYLSLFRSGAVGSEDPTPFLLLIAGLMTFYAMMRYRAFDLAPMAERELFADMPDGVIVLDSSGTVTSANELAARLLELESNRLIGRSLLEATAHSPLAADLQDVLRSPASARRHLINYELYNMPRGLEIRSRPLQARNGAIAGTLLVLRDTTERLLMEQARARHLAALELLNTLARAANSALATDELVRTMVRTIAAQGWWDRVTVGTVETDGSLCVVADAVSGGELSYEGRIADPADFNELQAVLDERDSRLIFADQLAAYAPLADLLRRSALSCLLIVPMVDQDQVLGLLALGNRDERPIPSELVRLTETVGELLTDAIVRIRLYEAVRQTNELKSSFLATMSHELRTPLTSIIGYIEMFQRGTYGQLPERTRDPLAYMRYSSVTLLNLINDILDFSRMEAGFLTIDLQPINAARAIANVVGALRPQIEEKQLELQLEIEPDLPAVQANTARLEQVIANLLSNAIKFTPGGSITIRAHRHQFGVRISVIDTGIGIALADQEEVFKEFRRLEQRHARKSGGTGLGLAISRRLMLLMDGALSLESRPGHGSTFHCDLHTAVLGAVEPPTVMSTAVDE